MNTPAAAMYYATDCPSSELCRLTSFLGKYFLIHINSGANFYINIKTLDLQTVDLMLSG